MHTKSGTSKSAARTLKIAVIAIAVIEAMAMVPLVLHLLDK